MLLIYLEIPTSLLEDYNIDLIFILYQNCSVFLAMKYQFLIHNRLVFRTAAVSYVKGTVSQKNEFQIIMFTVAENTGSVNI